jgi:subtilisin family serine protease
VKRTIVILTLVGALVLACGGMVLAQSAAPGDGAQQAAVEKSAGQAVPGRYIVVLKDDANARNVADEHGRRLGAEVTSVYQHALRGYAAKIPSARLSEVKSDPRVLFVQPDSTAVAFGQTVPTGVNRIDGKSSSTAKIADIDGSNGSDQRVNADVAVIDTGINKTHPDLNVVGGRNFATFFSPSNNYEDGHGHGTHVAGTIAALDNSNGAVGVAPGANLYGVKVLSNSGTGYQSWIIKGIDWVTAHANTIDVANMSLGGTGTDGSCGSNAYHMAICNSVAAGVTYTVAAGNSNANFQNFVPATYSEVLTVTAVSDSDGVSGGQGAAPSCRTGEKDDYPATFSNYATPLTSDQNPLTSDQNHTIAAPGVCIYSTWKNGGYNTISGTSMASPHVAGAAALYKANHPTATPAEVMTELRRDERSASAWAQSNGFTGDPLHSPIAGRYYGYLTHVDGY